MDQPQVTYLHLVKTCDSFPQDESLLSSYYALYLPGDSLPHGYLTASTVNKMPWTGNFKVNSSAPRSVTVLDSSEGKNTAEAVNAAFSQLITLCIDTKLFHVLDGKHSELFAIIGANLPIRLERFASALFGITTRGAHLIAYTRSSLSSLSSSLSPTSSSLSSSSSSIPASAGMKLWVPRRAPHLYTAPGKLDSTVAGGVKAGASPLETIVAEAREEASLPREYVLAHVRARGVVTTMSTTGDGFPGEKGLVVPNIDYVYDMELVGDMVPRPLDDEVEKFHCMTVAEVQAALLAGQFKAESAVVMIDFFIRHGILTDENEKDYVEIIGHLHRRLPFRVRPE